MKAIRKVPAIVGLLLVFVGMPPRSALAMQPTEDDANAAALAGRYSEALEAYAKLYAKTREPTYLHNVARCYQKLGRPDEAIDYFKKYLRLAKDLEEGVKAEVSGYIREMEALKESRKREKAASAASHQLARPVPTGVLATAPDRVGTSAPLSSAMPAPAFSTPVPTTAPAAVPQAGAGQPLQPPVPGSVASGPSRGPLISGKEDGGANAKPTRQLRTAAAIAAAVALAATGVGVYYGMRTGTLEGEVASAPKFDEAKDSAGERAHTLQFVMYGVGAACFAGSAVLYYLSLRTEWRSGTVSLLPSVGPAFAAGTITTRF